jgi:hypothetical protein
LPPQPQLPLRHLADETHILARDPAFYGVDKDLFVLRVS